MKRGPVPLWLLRDLPALVGLAWSFWPLMIMVISSGRRAMLGRKISPRIYDCIMHMLPIAEAHLHYALCRQAYRALGWNVREVRLEILPPITNWSQVAARFEFYRAQMMDLRAASIRFTEGLRETYRISARVDANSVRAAHAPAFAALRRDESTGVTRASARRPSTCRAEAQRRREHERGLTYARGPPGFSNNRKPAQPCLSAPTRLRSRPHAYRGTPSIPDSLPALSDRSRISTRFWSTGPGN